MFARLVLLHFILYLCLMFLILQNRIRLLIFAVSGFNLNSFFILFLLLYYNFLKLEILLIILGTLYKIFVLKLRQYIFCDKKSLGIRTHDPTNAALLARALPSSLQGFESCLDLFRPVLRLCRR